MSNALEFEIVFKSSDAEYDDMIDFDSVIVLQNEKDSEAIRVARRFIRDNEAINSVRVELTSDVVMKSEGHEVESGWMHDGFEYLVFRHLDLYLYAQSKYNSSNQIELCFVNKKLNEGGEV